MRPPLLQPRRLLRAPGLKTVEDATEIRRRVFLAFGRGGGHHDRRHAWLTFVIVGAGPTGVELAGALAEIANETCGTTSATSIRGRPRSCSSRRRIVSCRLSADLSDAAAAELGGWADAGATVIALDARCPLSRRRAGTDRGAHGDVGRGCQASRSAQCFATARGTPRSRRGVMVASISRAGISEVFVIGDLALRGETTAARRASPRRDDRAAGWRADPGALRGPRPPGVFRRDRGSMAVIGRGAAVADLG